MFLSIKKLGFILLSSIALNPLTTQAYELSKLKTNHIKKVLLVVAMENEAKPIISRLNLHQLSHPFTNLPMQAYSGNYHHLEVFLVMNGQDQREKVQNVGTQAATLSTYLGIERFHPDLIISIGTAGGVSANGAKLGDIYVSKKIYFFDRRLPSKGYYEYGLGGYPSVNFTGIDKYLKFKSGIICSGDSFDENKTDYKMFMKLHCEAIDMEAAGVAWVSMLKNIPMFAMKGITNFVKGSNIHEQYQQHFSSVTMNLANALSEWLKRIQ